MTAAPDHAPDRFGALARLVLLFRLIALNITVLEVFGNPDRTPEVVTAFAVTVVGSYLPLRHWHKVGPALLRRPALLGLDLALTLGVMWVVGVGSPFALYAIGTALLAGLVGRAPAAALASVTLFGGYFALLLGRDGLGADLAADGGSLTALVTVPVLFPLGAAGGAAIRRGIDREARTEERLRRAEAAAVASDERARVAREMHDSLGKTLYGIALSATALAARVKHDAPGAADTARDLAAAAQVAAAEARELITDLRSDTLDLPLGAALRGEVERWSTTTGVHADFRGDEVDLPHPGTRYELFCVVREALRNVEAHAAAARVAVTLTQRNGEISLEVADDGCGLTVAPGTQVSDLEPDGHFGLIGMGERATRVGGRLELASAPGAGTTVSVRLPAGDVRAPEPWSPAPPTDVVTS